MHVSKLLWLLLVLFVGFVIYRLANVVLEEETQIEFLPVGSVEVNLRSQTKSADGTWQVAVQQSRWNPTQTAIIVVDMWDAHWCESATQRVGELAPRMDEVLVRAREKGITIVHAPSGTMEYYQQSPQRKKALALPHHEAPPGFPINDWCYLDPNAENPLPIDDSDGGCDKPCADGQPCVERTAWSKQTPLLTIGDEDYITDKGQEVFNLLSEKGIENVIIMGVHTNMCILGRPFAIRQLANLGKNVVLMRDMTDSMYNPERHPYVSHFEGTDLVVDHVEKFWGPTMLSTDITGKPAFVFAEDTRGSR
ncbi:cysteine hydrolase family protein [Lunatimonas lonarensis]|uniref:cysteine hydrolase family protein n=1 Tax=Lunatimonas lonarensis TaxID=1232681 RepID=UPI0012DEF3EE|nr:isochorismatase family protein [Lunatimonas lonarensis]